MPKLDNIDLDMQDAERLGYGVHYGHFKMDHPFTKEKNEARLSGKKPSPSTKQYVSVKRVYEKPCPTCGKKFTTTAKVKKYCCERCREEAKKRKWSRGTTK